MKDAGRRVWYGAAMLLSRRGPHRILFAALVGFAGCTGDDADADADGGTSAATSSSDGATPSADGNPGSTSVTPSKNDSTDGGQPSGRGSETGSETSTGGDTTADDSTDTTGDPPQACADNWPQWNDGTDCELPDIQVHQVSDNTFLLRQSLCSNFEAPFMYLLFGSQRVLLQDTGAGNIEIAAAVYSVIDDWLAANNQASIELVVVNSHGHGDHTQGNAMFQGQPDTVVVGTSVAAVSSFFGINNWPQETVQYDLGDRTLDIIAIPGHQSSHIAIYDHGEQWLLTGDTLYPGRLYIADFPTYVESIERMVDHVADLPTCNVMGTHVEMTTTAGDDFPFGAVTHPSEHALQLTSAHLTELRDGVAAMAAAPAIEVHDDFIIYPL